MNKRNKHFIDAYERSRHTNLSQCYKTFSEEKRKAQLICRWKMQRQEGWDFRIISYNTNKFTCGWQTAGELHIETAYNSYVIPYKNLPF